MCQCSMHIMYLPELEESCLMLIYSLLSAYFDDVIPQQPALSNDGKQRQPALGDFTSHIEVLYHHLASSPLSIPCSTYDICLFIDL
jgi:hypothetical protein